MAHESEFLQLMRAGVFQVDVEGRVWRLMTADRTGEYTACERRRADYVNSTGYRLVAFTFARKRRQTQAHRVVYIVLVGPLESDQELNHKNGDKGDNKPLNLEILTRGKNIAHAYRELGRTRPTGEGNPAAKLTDVQVDAVRQLQGQRPSRAVGTSFGISHRQVLNIWNGKSRTP